MTVPGGPDQWQMSRCIQGFASGAVKWRVWKLTCRRGIDARDHSRRRYLQRQGRGTDGRSGPLFVEFSEFRSIDVGGSDSGWSHRFRVVRYDQRGHGYSIVSTTPYSIAQLGRDAIGIMNMLGISKAHWCGLSLGGMVGMWVLTHARGRIERAVLANTAAHMGPPELWNERIQGSRERRDGRARGADDRTMVL